MASLDSSLINLPAAGAFQPVPDVNSDRVQLVGMFAVEEYNKEHPEKDDLVFIEVVEAQSQVVNGENYSLLIKVFDAGVNVRFYKALVHQRDCIKTLTKLEAVLP